jgi:hypothetical protein
MKKAFKILSIIVAMVFATFACDKENVEKNDIKITAFKVSDCKSSDVDKTLLKDFFPPRVITETIGNVLQISIQNIIFSCGLEDVQRTINVSGNEILEDFRG